MTRINTKALFSLITPSFLSGVLCSCVALIILIEAGLAYIDENLLFYDYLFGRLGIVTLLQVSPDISAWHHTLLQNSATYVFTVSSIALIAGLLLYVLLQLLSLIIQESGVIMRAMKDNTRYSHDVMHQILTAAGLRIISIVAWGVYWVFFTSTAFPGSILILRSGIDDINNSMLSGWLLILASMCLLWACLHVTVVFARLSFMRTRLFSRG